MSGPRSPRARVDQSVVFAHPGRRVVAVDRPVTHVLAQGGPELPRPVDVWAYLADIPHRHDHD